MQIRQLILGELETNCYVVWDSTGQTLIIDPADDAEAILELVRQENLCVTAVVLTHAHFDHMLAAQSVCDTTNAPLYVGAGDADAMTDANRNLSAWFDPSHIIRVPHYRVLHEGDVLPVGEMSFTVMETPGHTPGCICLKHDGHLFSGDTLFADSIGRLDFPGGNTNDMIASLHRLMLLPPETRVYPGHGSATTIGREVEHNPYLQ